MCPVSKHAFASFLAFLAFLKMFLLKGQQSGRISSAKQHDSSQSCSCCKTCICAGSCLAAQVPMYVVRYSQRCRKWLMASAWVSCCTQKRGELNCVPQSFSARLYTCALQQAVHIVRYRVICIFQVTQANREVRQTSIQANKLCTPYADKMSQRDDPVAFHHQQHSGGTDHQPDQPLNTSVQQFPCCARLCVTTCCQMHHPYPFKE